MRKLRKQVVAFILAISIVLLGLAFFVKEVIKYKQIPYIAFMSNHDRETCLYICKNGDIYASTSGESFIMEKSDVVERICQNDYSDILNYVGSIKAREVRHMYDLFSEVVLDEEYRLRTLTYDEPEDPRYNPGKWYWYGWYYDEHGEFLSEIIYISDDDHECSDRRAYEIVDWMCEVLKEYMK